MTEILAPSPRALSLEKGVLPPALGEESGHLEALRDRARAHFSEPWSRRVGFLEERFKELRDRWEKETAWTSSWTELVLHPCYQQIIGLGPGAIPVLLREMSRVPDHWGWALFAITGVDPVPPGDAGRIDRIAAAWLAWGRENGHLP